MLLSPVEIVPHVKEQRFTRLEEESLNVRNRKGRFVWLMELIEKDDFFKR